MSTPHPEFNDSSSCENCAAFVPERSDGVGMLSGSCHRHAPRAEHSWHVYRANANRDSLVYEADPAYAGITWPDIVDQFSCCEWLPKPQAPSAEGDDDQN